MPTKRTFNKRIRRKRRGLATNPQMMTRSLAFKRLNQVSTKVFYFKMNNQISLHPDGNYQTVFDFNLLYTIPRFLSYCDLYDQYKVLGYTVRLFQATVGIESHAETATHTETQTH